MTYPFKPVLTGRLFATVLAMGSLAAFAQDSDVASLASATAAYETVVVERLFDGTVEAVNQATVSAQTAGRIAEVLYDVDDFVEAGAVIIRFTDVEQRSALRQAEAQLAAARAVATEAEEGYRRALNLRERGLGSQRDLDRAQAARDSATARVTAAESAVETVRQQLEYTVIRAPYAGIVTRRHVEVGEAVTPGQPLMSGLSLEHLRVVADLPQSVASQVRANPQAAVITAEGRVDVVDVTLFPTADPVTNTFRVRLELPPGQFGLYPGMFVKAAFKTGTAERLLVPSEAVFHRSEVTAVYVIEADDARLRQVRSGRTVAGKTEILAGLRAGESVALDPVRAGMLAKSGIRADDER